MPGRIKNFFDRIRKKIFDDLDQTIAALEKARNKEAVYEDFEKELALIEEEKQHVRNKLAAERAVQTESTGYPETTR